MKLVTYAGSAGWMPGVLSGEAVIDLNHALARAGVTGGGLSSTRAFLEEHGDHLGHVCEALGAVLKPGVLNPVGTLGTLTLGPPVPNPRKVLCVGLNYAEHVGEVGRKLPTHPDVFSKFDTSLIGPDSLIGGSDVSDRLDFEGELAVVIGRPCSRVTEAEAPRYVAGYSVLNDISARDLQWRGTQWLAGKAVDGSTPFGPWLLTSDEVSDPQSLAIRTLVNDAEVQSSNTKHMIFSVAQIVAYISSFLTLLPGDVIATGTPDGIGAKRQPPLWLRPGDRVQVTIEGVASLTNEVG